MEQKKILPLLLSLFALSVYPSVQAEEKTNSKPTESAPEIVTSNRLERLFVDSVLSECDTTGLDGCTWEVEKCWTASPGKYIAVQQIKKIIPFKGKVTDCSISNAAQFDGSELCVIAHVQSGGGLLPTDSNIANVECLVSYTEEKPKGPPTEQGRHHKVIQASCAKTGNTGCTGHSNEIDSCFYAKPGYEIEHVTHTLDLKKSKGKQKICNLVNGQPDEVCLFATVTSGSGGSPVKSAAVWCNLWFTETLY